MKRRLLVLATTCCLTSILAIQTAAQATGPSPCASPEYRQKGGQESDDAKTVAALDTKYQAAVKANDAAGMDRILADDFVLVLGNGKSYNKSELLETARRGDVTYEHQEDTEQKVRVYGDTAIVTAKLFLKGTQGGKPFERTLWFSDTYVRTPTGWRYVFGQASLPLPAN